MNIYTMNRCAQIWKGAWEASVDRGEDNRQAAEHARAVVSEFQENSVDAETSKEIVAPPRLKCSTGPVQWTCTLKTQNGIPTLTVTMGDARTVADRKEIDLFDLFGEEMDHHPTDDV